MKSQEEFSAVGAKIVGNIEEGVWAQVASLGNLHAVIVLTGVGEGNSGRKLLTFLEEEEAKLEKKNLAHLVMLLEKLQGLILPEEQLAAVLAMTSGEVLYLVSSKGAAFLKRGGSLEKIIEGQEKVSGFLKDGDLLILGSEQFFQIIPRPLLEEHLDHFSPAEIAERLAPQVSLSEENAGCAALILNFKRSEIVGKDENNLEEERAVEEKVSAGKGSFSKLSFLAAMVRKIKFFKLRIPRFWDGLEVTGEESGGRQRRVLLTVAVTLAALLAVSIFLGVGKMREGERTKKFDELYRSASLKYEEGKSLIALNDVLARSRIGEVQEQIAQLKKIDSLSQDQEKRIKELEKKLEENLVVLSRVYKLTSLPVFWEIGLVKEGGEGESLAISDDKIAILDKKNHLAYLLSVKTKAFDILGGEELKDEPGLMSLGSGKLDFLTGKGLVRLDVKSKKIQLAVNKDEVWGEPVSMASYGGNLYLLSKGQSSQGSEAGQIWKYTAGESGFSAKRSYLASDIKPDFSQVKDMAIDGSVWILSPGAVSKFTQGRPDSFIISGLESEFGQPQAIFTDEQSKNLYLLDSQSKRVLVLAKDGVYQAQYEAEEISQVRDLVVSEKEKKIFLLAGSKVYAIEIK
ncbi:MAG: hypothetical protein Q8P89_01915 [bacterium]|nr:hypothetical protein [bacterium]